MKNTMAKIMYAFITLFLFIVSSCKETNQRLEYALDFAGSNRVELEKVLDYYKGDALKLKASYFLIENMPRYFSYTGHVLDSIKAIKASVDEIGKIIYSEQEMSGDLGWTSSKVPGLVEKCPDKGNGCTAYSCMQTNK